VVKPVSAQTLLDRLIAILAKQRPIVQVGDYYGPEPRRLFPDELSEPSFAPAPQGTTLN
jgi:hypothetical protein